MVEVWIYLLRIEKEKKKEKKGKRKKKKKKKQYGRLAFRNSEFRILQPQDLSVEGSG